MSLQNKNIGIALTGSFCTFDKTFEEIEKLLAIGANVYPVLSFNSQKIDSRFGKAADFYKKLVEMTGHEPITTIEDAEPVGPKNMFDVMAVIPCTGNSLAKMANGITDTPVLMAAKAHIRNNKPLVISLATNDALGINLKNIGILINQKNIYFVPFGQDSPSGKPKSMIAHTNLLSQTLEAALEGNQIQPVIVSPF